MVRTSERGCAFKPPGALARGSEALPGRHQIDNAAMAFACAERLEGFGIDDAASRRGCRMQRLTDGRRRPSSA
jgi:UDP-N-acetylmuramyl tripeptide synthase